MSRRAARYRARLIAGEVRRQQLRAEAVILATMEQRLAELHQLAELLAVARAAGVATTTTVADHTASAKGGLTHA